MTEEGLVYKVERDSLGIASCLLKSLGHSVSIIDDTLFVLSDRIYLSSYTGEYDEWLSKQIRIAKRDKCLNGILGASLTWLYSSNQEGWYKQHLLVCDRKDSNL